VFFDDQLTYIFSDRTVVTDVKKHFGCRVDADYFELLANDNDG
jgi:hypothetical protein